MQIQRWSPQPGSELEFSALTIQIRDRDFCICE
jgi:hypothetical protein